MASHLLVRRELPRASIELCTTRLSIGCESAPSRMVCMPAVLALGAISANCTHQPPAPHQFSPRPKTTEGDS